MTPRSPAAAEARTRTFLTELLAAVPIARGQGTAAERLAALERAALFTPVFADWPTPVDEWLQEGCRLAGELGRTDVVARLELRQAVIHMRRLALDAAQAAVDAVQIPATSPTAAADTAWRIATQARILVRRQGFDAARALLATITPPPRDTWTAWLPIVARAELEVEAGDYGAASATLHTALEGMPGELVEERIQCLQALGFVLVTRGDARAARRPLDHARHLLRAAGAWPEVIQMNLAVGSLSAAVRDHSAAQRMFQEAGELCRRHPRPQLEALLHMGAARSAAALGAFDLAVAAALEAARHYAAHGSVVGYVSMVVFVARLYAEANHPAEAYRTLATGLAVARHRRWQVVEDLLRTRIKHLREDVVGAEAFDAMVTAMLEKHRQTSAGSTAAH
ncbi:MAG: hypothetical protein LPJ94_13320 [Thauera sp.]|nr:hypothetical protein [Thauera sp.]